MKKVKSKLYRELSEQFERKNTTEELLYDRLVKKALSLKSVSTSNDPDKIVDKLSDIVWYVTRIAAKQNSSLEELMAYNLMKLESMLLNSNKL